MPDIKCDMGDIIRYIPSDTDQALQIMMIFQYGSRIVYQNKGLGGMFKSPIYLHPISPYTQIQNAKFYRTFSPHPNNCKKTYRFWDRQHPNICKKSYNKWDYITTQILLTKHILSYIIHYFHRVYKLHYFSAYFQHHQ